jgi:hypothetical protein
VCVRSDCIDYNLRGGLVEKVAVFVGDVVLFIIGDNLVFAI